MSSSDWCKLKRKIKHRILIKMLLAFRTGVTDFFLRLSGDRTQARGLRAAEGGKITLFSFSPFRNASLAFRARF